MANLGHGKKFEQMKEKLLEQAKKEFYLNGYKSTKIADVCKMANVDNNAVARVFCDKKTLFFKTMEQVGKEQNKIVKKLLKDKKDSLLEYFLQCAIKLIFSSLSAQSTENFSVYYEKKKTNIDKRLYDKLQKSFTNVKKEDFYLNLIAIEGIISSFICLTDAKGYELSEKIEKFSHLALKIMDVGEEKASKIMQFITSEQTIEQLLNGSRKLMKQIVGE